MINNLAKKFKRALLQKEPCRAKTLRNVKFLYGLLSDQTKTSEREGFFNSGI